MTWEKADSWGGSGHQALPHTRLQRRVPKEGNHARPESALALCQGGQGRAVT